MRRRSRECALQLLYQFEAGEQLTKAPQGEDLRRAFDDYWSSFKSDRPVDKEFAERLVVGVLAEVTQVDETIKGASKRWKVERMSQVDRNLLRVAVYELKWCTDIPTGVSINEALEIAKRFSGGEAVPFLNGILDFVAKEGQS